MTDTNNQDNFEKELKNQININKSNLIKNKLNDSDDLDNWYNSNDLDSDNKIDYINIVKDNSIDNLIAGKFEIKQMSNSDIKRKKEAEIWYINAVEKHKKSKERERELRLKYGNKKYEELKVEANLNNYRNNLIERMTIKEHGQPYKNKLESELMEIKEHGQPNKNYCTIN